MISGDIIVNNKVEHFPLSVQGPTLTDFWFSNKSSSTRELGASVRYRPRYILPLEDVELEASLCGAVITTLRCYQQITVMHSNTGI